MNWGEIDNLWGFLAVCVFLIANLALNVYGQRKGRERRDEDRGLFKQMDNKVDVIKGEIKNDHPDDANLRDQVDRIEIIATDLKAVVEDVRDLASETRDRFGDVADDISGLRKDVGGIRGETRNVRDDHTGLVRRLNDFIRREHPGADPL